MTARELPRSQWENFFDNFSKTHAGWTVNLEVYDPDLIVIDPNLGSCVEAREMSLGGVVANLRESPPSIEILMGETAPQHMSRNITHPLRVRVWETDAHACERIEIESADGLKTDLYLLPMESAEESSGPAFSYSTI